MADLRKPHTATEAVQHQADNPVVALLAEYFALKARDKAIRVVRNEYMKDHHCLNLDRLMSSYQSQDDYEDNGGECIRRTVGMGGYPAPLCEVCEKRNAWYAERQRMSHRRSAIMQKLKRLVAVTDLEPSDPEATAEQAKPPNSNPPTHNTIRR